MNRHPRPTTLALALACTAAAGHAPAASLLERMGMESLPIAADASPAPLAVRGGAPVAAELIARQGTALPGGGGLLATGLNSPFTNGLGQPGFTGNLNNAGSSDPFVWSNAQVIWRNSSAVGNTLTGTEGTMGIGNSGQFVYSPAVNGNDAVWTQAGLLATEGQAAPGFPVGAVLTFNSRPTMTPPAVAHWVAGFNLSGGTTSEGRVIYAASVATPTVPSVVLRSDDVVGGFAIARPTGIGFDYDFSDDSSHHIHELTLVTGSTANDAAVYVDGTLVAREGSSTGGVDNWANFDAVSINTAGNYVFTGDTGGAVATDEFIAYNGVIAQREGDSVDGVNLTTPASVQAASLNNLGEVAYLWSVSGGAEHLFVACDAAALTATSYRLLSSGDGLDFTGDGIADATVTDFNASTAIGPGLSLGDDGRVLVELDIQPGGGEVEAIVALDLPLACTDLIFANGFQVVP